MSNVKIALIPNSGNPDREDLYRNAVTDASGSSKSRESRAATIEFSHGKTLRMEPGRTRMSFATQMPRERRSTSMKANNPPLNSSPIPEAGNETYALGILLLLSEVSRSRKTTFKTKACGA